MATDTAPRSRRLALATRLRMRGAQFALLHYHAETNVLFGTPPSDFAAACQEILNRGRHHDAWVAQTGHGLRARLIFSSSLDEGTRQRIRNAWTPPRRPTSGGTGQRA